MWEYTTVAFERHSFESGLNEFGRGNWELVTCWHNANAQILCVFKRRKA